MEDLLLTLKSIEVVFYLSLSDLKARYKNSILGPLWISLGTGIFIFGLAIIWGELFNKDRSNFVPSMAVGMLMWHFISSCLYESTTIFVNKSSVIKNINLPLFIYPLQIVIKQLINFAHNFVIYIIIFFIYDIQTGLNIFYFIPLMILFLINMLWITLLFSIVGSRFRDFTFVISSILPLLFFLTPVLYSPSDLNFLRPALWLNPFSHFISIIRAPLIGSNIELDSLIFCLIFMVLGWIMTIYLFNRTRDKIIFWI